MTTKVKKLLIEKLIEGKPIVAKGLRLTSSKVVWGTQTFTLQIIDDKGEVLVDLDSFALGVGDQVTILDLDKVFNITVGECK